MICGGQRRAPLRWRPSIPTIQARSIPTLSPSPSRSPIQPPAVPRPHRKTSTGRSWSLPATARISILYSPVRSSSYPSMSTTWVTTTPNRSSWFWARGQHSQRQGTPQPSTSGSGADLTNFAPLGSFQHYRGRRHSQRAHPRKLNRNWCQCLPPYLGAYTLKTSFVYSDVNGVEIVE